MSPIEIFIAEIPDAVKFTVGLAVLSVSFAWWSISEARWRSKELREGAEAQYRRGRDE